MLIDIYRKTIKMKRGLLFIFLTCSMLTLMAQKRPLILARPADWRFEQFTLPPEFAPAVKYKGLEELRFSPGWGDKNATDYFTLIFGIRFDDTKSVSQEDIKNYLLTYFRGLCDFTVKARKLSPVDTSAIKVTFERQKKQIGDRIYNVTLNMFGVFTDGAPITLNMEIKVSEDPDHQRVYLHIIASPLPKTHPVWKGLHEEQLYFAMKA